MTAVATQTETIQVSGIRCERCVLRLGAALERLQGIEAANANLVGEVTLAWNDERVGRDDIVAAMSAAGFRELAAPHHPQE